MLEPVGSVWARRCGGMRGSEVALDSPAISAIRDISDQPKMETSQGMRGSSMAMRAVGAACLKRPGATYLQHRAPKGYVRRPFTKGSFCLRCNGRAQMSGNTYLPASCAHWPRMAPSLLACDWQSAAAQLLRSTVAVASCVQSAHARKCQKRLPSAKRRHVGVPCRPPPKCAILAGKAFDANISISLCYGRTLCCSSPFVVPAWLAWRQGPGGSTAGGAPGARPAQLRYL